uniref:Uncharacterized protein n=1 Tax=Oryza meridionalis TaxID=40149 RepID=A0A0E0CWW7_9ORYZ
MEWSRSAESRGVQGKPHRKIIRDDKKKRIQAGIASDDVGDEVVVFSEKEEAAMAKIFDKVKAKMPADPPAAAAHDDAPPPPAPATVPAAIGAALAPSTAPAPSASTTSPATP